MSVNEEYVMRSVIECVCLCVQEVGEWVDGWMAVCECA